MNRKSFLTLLVVLLVLGGAGLGVFWQDLIAWRGSDTKIGSKVFDKLQVNDIAQIRIFDAKGEVNLVSSDKRWIVKQRGDYTANYQDISDLLVKLPDLKVVQTENVGASLLPRLNLVAPVKDEKKDAKPVENSGTQFELMDTSGKVIASLLLGKKVIKTEDSPLPIKPQKDVGRYVLSPGHPTVLVTSDALSSAEAKPERWLAREFFKVEKVKSLTSSGEGATWKVARPEEYGQWKFADGSDQLNSTVSTAAVNSLTALTIADVVPGATPDLFAKSRTFVADTFENLVYTIRIAKKTDDDYYLKFIVSGEPHKARPPETGFDGKAEKPEQAATRDKEFAEDMKRLAERLKREKELSGWTFVVTAKTVESLLKARSDLVAEKRPPAPKK